ncbi:CWF19-like protein 2 [Linum grandiflorum]
MLAGVKFIPRDQVDGVGGVDKSNSSKKRRKDGKREKRGKKSSRSKSSSDEDLERIKEGSRRKKKWYSSDDYSSSSSSEDEDRKGKARKIKRVKRSRKVDYSPDDRRESDSFKEMEIARKEMGLDWMLRPADASDKRAAPKVDEQPVEPAEEVKRVNPTELNPYLKDDGSGYPDEVEEKRSGDRLPTSAVVGDGGASWRLKALKRAEEQAARDGRKLDEVVEERWGSLGQLAASAASHRAAPSRAHLHAIRSRQMRQKEEQRPATNGQHGKDIEKTPDRSYLKDVSVRHPEMKAPKVRDSLSWGKQKIPKLSTSDASIISSAASSLNKFANDGNFMNQVLGHTSDLGSSNAKLEVISKVDSSDRRQPAQCTVVITEGMTANQLAAKALQLRLKGKHEEADILMKESEKLKEKQNAGEQMVQPQTAGSANRYVAHHSSTRKKDDDSADKNLARTIMQNKQYSLSGRADDEYDFEDGPTKKSRKKEKDNGRKSENMSVGTHIMTQQERCLFCFENPNRPKHLVLSIANLTYLMLPQRKPVVPGHCCILTLQHESSTRTVDDNVWEEIRNFKKCLIMMFAKQEKEVVFLETVMGLAQQRRHCLVECIPLPQDVAKEAPLYFKKAIDEAEDEWSQHNAKKLIDTSIKGLRGSIPKDFPYFHVEFGLKKGFVHVIDNESQFNSSLGLNVIRGMMQLPEEDMYRRRRQDSAQGQKLAVAEFVRDWQPLDWTKQL